MSYKKFLRAVSDISDLIGENPRFDGKKWDWGQWVCVLLYGDKWMEHPEFNEIDITHEIPESIWPRLKRLKEWLQAELK